MIKDRYALRTVLILAGATLALPASAHGAGIALIGLGGPLLLASYALLLVRALFFVPRRRRGRVVAMTLLAVPLCLLMMAGPFFIPVLDRLLLDFEVSWSLLVPPTLAVLGWILQNRISRGPGPARK